ncbi:MAG: hypothetical protein JW881_00580 [Spirochaetales bacterium]|nr:hypothetical protein [Spirochaetales bacterium]
MKKLSAYFLLVILMLSLAACAAGPNELKNVAAGEKKVAGFWQGLWHGIITPVTFIISLFNKNVNIYEVHNNGGWYNLGFILGLIIIFGGSSGSAGRMTGSRSR